MTLSETLFWSVFTILNWLWRPSAKDPILFWSGLYGSIFVFFSSMCRRYVLKSGNLLEEFVSASLYRLFTPISYRRFLRHTLYLLPVVPGDTESKKLLFGYFWSRFQYRKRVHGVLESFLLFHVSRKKITWLRRCPAFCLNNNQSFQSLVLVPQGIIGSPC